MALESVVLLKNQDNFLPLDKKKIKSIAVIGPLADVVHWDWYGGTPPYAITPLQGIRNEAGPDVKVNYAAYDTPDGEDAALEAASESDVAVVVVGNNPTCGDEGHSWYEHAHEAAASPCPAPIPATDAKAATAKPWTSIRSRSSSRSSSRIRTPWSCSSPASPTPSTGREAHVPAILTMAHASQDEGTALAQVLFGDYNPGGHLVRTWPKSADQLPARMDYNIRDGYTYMYFKGQPLYPFGFGLSYTTFKLSNLRTRFKARWPKTATVTVSVDVTNTGTRAGDEVVQLYVQHLHSAVSRPQTGVRRLPARFHRSRARQKPSPSSSRPRSSPTGTYTPTHSASNPNPSA